MIEQLLKDALENSVSDIHITTDDFIAFRSKKKIEKLSVKTTDEDVLRIAKQLADERFDLFLQNKQMDVSGELGGVRYRANIYYERGNIAIAIRIVNNNLKSIIELGLPHILFELIKKQSGLILVTGPTGCGKSTTLAAMINEINKDFAKHIITIEDPIEYVFTNMKSIIHQRELGPDLDSYSEGLRSVLRQDPDIIMLGELRDKTTIQTALKAAETGHLVLTTLHTSSVRNTINRMTSVFSADEAQKIRSQLSESLIAILTQKLIRTRDGRGVVPAFEILINTVATSNLIRKGEESQLNSYLLMDQKLGSIPMEKSIANLVKQGYIDQNDVE